MPRTKKGADGTPKRSEAQRAADKRYQEKNKERNKANARARYKTGFRSIGAQLKTAEAEATAATYKAHGVTVAQILRAAAERLTTDGETAAAQIKAAAAAYIARAEKNAQSAPKTDESQNPNA